MKTCRQTRAGGFVGHLLLVTLLAFGIVTMHSFGHPGGVTRVHAAASHAAAMDSDRTHTAALGQSPSSRDNGSVPGDGHVMATASGAVAEAPQAASAPGNPGGGMDLMTVCLAVLSVWTLAVAALMCAALARGRHRPLNPQPYAVVTHRPNPPPRPPLLSQLSILRI